VARFAQNWLCDGFAVDYKNDLTTSLARQQCRKMRTEHSKFWRQKSQLFARGGACSSLQGARKCCICFCLDLECGRLTFCPAEIATGEWSLDKAAFLRWFSRLGFLDVDPPFCPERPSVRRPVRLPAALTSLPRLVHSECGLPGGLAGDHSVLWLLMTISHCSASRTSFASHKPCEFVDDRNLAVSLNSHFASRAARRSDGLRL
jgi:hypothetical protein